MFERFTDRARRAVVLSQQEARLADADTVGTEHVLLGLLRVDDTAQQLLRSLGLQLENTRALVAARPGRRSGSPGDHIPFTAEAKKGLEMSLREALDLGEHFIGTEHLLLGLLREGQSLAAELLREHGAELDPIRHQIRQIPSDVRRQRGAHSHEDLPGFGQD